MNLQMKHGLVKFISPTPVTTLAVLFFIATSAASQQTCTDWIWDYAPPGQDPVPHGGTMTMCADGACSYSDGSKGTWRRSGSLITFTWNNGHVDTLNLSTDQRVLAGRNESGWNVRGRLPVSCGFVRRLLQPASQSTEASVIYEVNCSGLQFYIYDYIKRPGCEKEGAPGTNCYRAIRVPDWGHAIGGRDFSSYAEAIPAAAAFTRSTTR